MRSIINVNDFASKLERSVKRSEKVLELEAQPMPQEERADACLVTSNVNRAPFDLR